MNIFESIFAFSIGGIGLGGVLIVFLLIIIFFIFLYNGLVKKRIRTEEAWGDIDVQLKRRYDLIPNLVEAVKGYVKHESETLRAVTEARTKAASVNIDVSKINPEQLTALSSAQSDLTGALTKLFAVAESYPDLKASQNFVELQRDLVDTENKIQAARRFYNTTIQTYNVAVDSFPSLIVAKMFNFIKKEFFELEENSPEKENVKVSF